MSITGFIKVFEVIKIPRSILLKRRQISMKFIWNVTKILLMFLMDIYICTQSFDIIVKWNFIAWEILNKLNSFLFTDIWLFYFHNICKFYTLFCIILARCKKLKNIFRWSMHAIFYELLVQSLPKSMLGFWSLPNSDNDLSDRNVADC